VCMVLSMGTGYARNSPVKIDNGRICTSVLQDFRETTEWTS
jgi:hypothetical protein